MKAVAEASPSSNLATFARAKAKSDPDGRLNRHHETTATMHASNSMLNHAPLSKGGLWTARIISGGARAVLLVDAVGNR